VSFQWDEAVILAEPAEGRERRDPLNRYDHYRPVSQDENGLSPRREIEELS
jgi:hypothetical protein